MASVIVLGRPTAEIGGSNPGVPFQESSTPQGTGFPGGEEDATRGADNQPEGQPATQSLGNDPLDAGDDSPVSP